MPSDEEFQKFYDDTLKPQIDEHYKQKKVHLIRRWLWIVVLFLGLYFINQIYFGAFVKGDVAYVVFTILGILFLYFIYLIASSVNTEMNKKTMPAIFEEMIRFLSKDSKTEDILQEDKFVGLDSLEESNIFKIDDLEVTGGNLTNFYFNKEDLMTLSDLELFFWEQTEDKKNIKRYIFNGIFFSLDFEKEIKKDIFLIPKNRMNKFINAGGNEIHLENAELMHHYKIFCSDEIEVRKILSLSIMDRIDDINKIFPHIKYFAFRADDKLVILIDGLNIRRILDKELPLVYSEKRVMKKIKRLAAWFEKFMNLYNILDIEENLKEEEAEGKKPLPEDDTDLDQSN